MSAPLSKDTRVEHFERKVVFTTARLMYLTIAGVAALILVGSVLTGAYGVAPALDPGEPEMPELVSPEAVTQAQVEAILRDRLAASAPRPEPPGRTLVRREADADADLGEPPADAAVDPVTEALARIEAEFDRPGSYPWSDTQECARRGWRGECSRWSTKKGARTVLLEGIESGAAERMVPLLQHAHRLVKLAPQNDDGRFVYLGLFKDLMLATGGSPDDAVDTLEPLLADRAQWSDEALIGLAIGVIKAPTMGAGSAEVVPLLALADAVRETFGDGGVERAVISGWGLTRELSPEAEATAWQVILSSAAQVPEEGRQDVFVSYEQVLRASQSTADSQNAQLRRGWQGERDAYLAAQAAKEESKGQARAMAISGLGTGLLGLTSIAILLAILAVERNTRRFELLVRDLAASGALGALPERDDPADA